MLIVQKHLQAVTKALTGKEVAPIGELLDRIKQLRAENEKMRALLNDVGRYARHTQKWHTHITQCQKQALKGE